MAPEITVDTGSDTGPALDFESDRQETDREELHLDGTLALVGCGSAKRDPQDPTDLHVASVGPDEPMTSLPGAETGPAWEARDLYTSNYFAAKRDLADLVTHWARGYDTDEWAVLSAEHAVVPYSRDLKYYEKPIGEIGDDPTDPDDRVDNSIARRRPDGQEIVTEMDLWATNVAYSLSKWVAGFRGQHAKPWENDANELLVLAGQDYVEPLRDRGVFEYGIARMSRDPNDGFTFPLEPRFLFGEIPAGGNGDQMGWMSGAIERLEPVVSDNGETEQTALTDGGRDD